MKVRNRRLLAVLAALVAVSMIATGCGGGNKADSGNAGADSGKQVEIKIGIGAPLTAGAVALGEGMKRGAELAVAQANESQEAKDAGIKFATVDGDDQGDPKAGVTAANQFASQQNLIGVMGHLNSGVSIPASKIYNQKKIVMISPASTNPALTQQGFDNVFRVCTIDSVQGPAAADFAQKGGFKAAFVVDDSTPYGVGLADEFAKKFEANGGKVVGREKTTDKDTDFNALVTKMKGAGVDLIYYGGIYNSGALLSKQAKEAGVKAPLMGGDGLYDQEFINLAGADNAEGDLTTSIGYPVAKLPEGQAFQTAFKEMFPDAEIAAYDAYSYDAANIIIKATLQVAKEQGADKVTTPAGRQAVIDAVKNFSGTGVSGDLGFDEKGDTTNKVVSLYKVVGGKWVDQESQSF